MRSIYVKEFIGELVGTFVLVLFGCGTLASEKLFAHNIGLFQIGAAWGVAVALGIYAARHLSDAHLNPAVSIAMVALRRLPAQRLWAYLPAQFLGAFLAAVALYILFAAPIATFETANNIVRGTPPSVATASIFGAYYPSPGLGYSVTTLGACFAEGLGTFLLVLLALLITERRTASLAEYAFSPVFIGIAVAGIVTVIAPASSCAINPARDFGPKIFMSLAGWGGVALQSPFLYVYLLAPIAGALVAALFFGQVLRPYIFSGGLIHTDLSANVTTEGDEEERKKTAASRSLVGR